MVRAVRADVERAGEGAGTARGQGAVREGGHGRGERFGDAVADSRLAHAGVREHGLVQTRAAHGRDAAGGDGDFSHRK